METKKLFKTYLKYLVPTIGSMILYSTYTMVDGIFVGQGVGPLALSAVNVSMPFVTLSFASAILLAIGTSNLITYSLGRGRIQRGNQYFTMGLSLALGVSVVISLVAYLNLNSLALLLGSEPKIHEYVLAYLGTIILFSPFFCMTYMFEIMVKADRHPHLAIIFMVVSALTNIILDYVFIYIFHLGVRGAAIATGISQVLPCIGYTLHFLSDRANLKFTKFKMRRIDLRDMIRFGFPAALTEMSTGFTILVFNQVIANHYGVNGLAVFSVIVYLMNLIVNTMLSIVQSSQPLLSYNFGAKNMTHVKQLRKYVLYTILVSSSMMVLLIQLFPNAVLSIFLNHMEADFIELAVRAMRLFSSSFLILGFNIGIGGYLTAVQRPRDELIISLMRGYIVVALVVFTFPNLFGSSIIWLCLTISELITLIISLYFLRRERLQRTQA